MQELADSEIWLNSSKLSFTWNNVSGNHYAEKQLSLNSKVYARCHVLIWLLQVTQFVVKGYRKLLQWTTPFEFHTPSVEDWRNI